MLTDFLQDRAALYVAGEMSAAEREQFELLLEFHAELREHVAEVGNLSAALTASALAGESAKPSPELKARVLGKIAGLPQQTRAEAIVVSGVDGLVQWVSPAFTEMCGYELNELRGRKLGPILQGKDTDPATAARLREAVRNARPCRETILNYHKSGQPYLVDVDVTPVVDDAGTPLWLIAREHEVPNGAAA